MQHSISPVLASSERHGQILSFANRQIETRIVKQAYVLPLATTIVCFLMRINRVGENMTPLPLELTILEHSSNIGPLVKIIRHSTPAMVE